MAWSPWQSSGQGSELSLPGTRGPSLVRELRSHKPCCVSKKQLHGNDSFSNILNPTKLSAEDKERMKTFSEMQGVKIYLPYLPFQKAARECVHSEKK